MGRLQPLCYNKGPQDAQNPTAKACGRNSTTGERLEGWNVASAALPLGALNASQITAVRYGWSEDPCCPGADRTLTPCPPGSCPIQSHKSTLPAVPFLARIRGGKCDWNSIVDPPLR